nr:hypothetical protein [Ningiella ruwaisensis]
MKRQRTMKSNNQRRNMLKKLHQRVLFRRKQFAMVEMQEDFREAC